MEDEKETIDIGALGKSIYKRMSTELEATHKGKMVVIDVLSGDYEVGEDDLTATLSLFERRPDALTWGERIGYPAAYRIL